VTTASTTPAAPPPATKTPPAAQIAVPRLVGQDLAAALFALERTGLLANVVYESSQQPVGQVIGQNPAAGKSAARQLRVQLNLAEGPSPGNPVQLPDVAGEDAATARADLESAGFRVVVVQTKRTGTTGSVLEQQPAAGTPLSTGDIVAIYVP
jgi:serine/threonine-protein kinase